jgi:Carbohydrate binding domain
VATDIVSGALLFTIQKAGIAIGTRRALNLIEGANVTLAVADDAGNDRVNVTVAAASGATTHNLLSATHPDTLTAAPVLGDVVAANGTPAWARLAGNTAATRKFLRQTGTGTLSAAPAWDTLLAGDLPAHTHAESDVTGLATDLTNRPVKGGAWAVSKAAVINSSGQLDGASGTTTDCVLVNGSSAAKASATHTHAATDIVSGTLDNARTSATATATASTLVLRDGSGGASFTYVAANNQWAYLDSHFQSLESGAYQTVGGPFENMAKYSEDFTAATWDKNGGSCSATANSTVAPDGNTSADTITAVTATPIAQQQLAGLASGGQYTFYVWAKVASGTRQVSIAIVDNAYAGYLAGPTSITLTTAWQRFKITGTLAGGQTGLWIVVRQFAGNGDNWTSGAIYLWGACLQQGNDPKSGYARTWASQTGAVAAGIACGANVIAAKDAAESPFRIYGPGSNLADHRLLEVTAGGELILAGGTGNGYRLAELMGATNPSGWSGVLKVKTPAGATAGYILLYSNP